jgi:hypothetical protein
VYPARAGHDYGSVAARNFRKVLLDRDGKPQLLDRATALTQIQQVNR